MMKNFALFCRKLAKYCAIQTEICRRAWLITSTVVILENVRCVSLFVSADFVMTLTGRRANPECWFTTLIWTDGFRCRRAHTSVEADSGWPATERNCLPLAEAAIMIRYQLRLVERNFFNCYWFFTTDCQSRTPQEAIIKKFLHVFPWGARLYSGPSSVVSHVLSYIKFIKNQKIRKNFCKIFEKYNVLDDFYKFLRKNLRKNRKNVSGPRGEFISHTPKRGGLYPLTPTLWWSLTVIFIYGNYAILILNSLIYTEARLRGGQRRH